MKNKINKQKSTQTVLEFTPTRVKVIQAVSKGKRIVTCLVSSAYHGDSEREIADVVATIIKTHRLVIDRCIVLLDRSYVSLRLIKLPTTNEEEIKDMVRWQAAKSLPHTIDEIVVSHRIIKSDDEGFSHVLLAIIPQRSIEKYVRICDSLRIRPHVFTITSEGLTSWYLRQQSRVSFDEATALIDIEEERFEMAVLYQDKFIFSRSFSLSSNDVDRRMKEKIIENVKVSLQSYRKQEIYLPIKDMILVGTTNQVSDLVPLCTQEFNITPHVLNHLETIEVKKKVVRSSSSERISFAAGCGCLLSETPPHINLTPPPIQQRLLYVEKKQELLKTFALAAFVAIVCVGAISLNFYKRQEALNRLDDRLASISPTAREIQEIKNKMAIINAQLNNERSCLEILREIHTITPKQIHLFTFIFEDEKSVILKGSSPKMSLVFTFVPILSQSPFFENAQVHYATQRKTQQGESTDFEIACPLNRKATN